MKHDVINIEGKKTTNVELSEKIFLSGEKLILVPDFIWLLPIFSNLFKAQPSEKL